MLDAAQIKMYLSEQTFDEYNDQTEDIASLDLDKCEVDFTGSVVEE